MCKICENCQGVMNYDPYFEAEICSKCGKIERKKSQESISFLKQQNNNIESIKRVFQTVSLQ